MEGAQDISGAGYAAEKNVTRYFEAPALVTSYFKYFARMGSLSIITLRVAEDLGLSVTRSQMLAPSACTGER